MQLENEKTVDYVEFDLELNDEEAKFLIEHAKKHIFEDVNTLMNWSINDFLKREIEDAKAVNGKLSDMVDKKRKASKKGSPKG